jgi:hypothetical protein
MRPLIFDLLFKDDRMFVLELGRGTTRSLTSSEPAKQVWFVCTRRNVPGYPPTRSDSFVSRAEAITYYNQVVVATPRVSLGKRSPNPTPSLDDYKLWLKAEGLFDPVLNPGAPRPAP